MRLVYKLRVRSGPDKGLVLTLERKETLIGRGKDCQLTLNDPQASRHHCKVVVTGRKVEVVDLGSTNGTLVDGRPVERAAVKSGSVITVGDSEIMLFSEERREEGDRPKTEAEPSVAQNLTRRLGGLGLSTKVLALMVLLALLSQVLVAWPLISRQRTMLKEEALKQAAVLVMALAAANREALRSGDEMMIETRQLAQMPGVVAVMVYDRQGRTLAPVAQLHQIPDDPLSRRALAAHGLLVQPRGEDTYDLAQPVKVLNPKSGKFEKVGTARLVFSLSELARRQGGSWRAALISLVLLLAAAAGASLVIMRLLSRPVNQLRDQLEAALKGDQKEVTPPAGFPPLARLTASINRALAKLRALQETPPTPAAAPASTREEELAALAGVVRHPLAVADASNQVVLANRAFARALETDPDELRGRHLLEAIPDQALLAAVLELIKEATQGDQRVVARRLELEDGRMVEAAVGVVLDPAGEPALVAIAFQEPAAGHSEEA